jgi:putative endonuclease
MAWYVYVLVSERSARTYVGVTVDPERRLIQHNGGRAGGAKSTRAGRPWRLEATFGPFRSRGEAQRAEWEIKARPGRERLGRPVAGARDA